MTNDSLDTPAKRKASAAGLDGVPTTRPVKRRASKACQCCRARKVRCNVTEHGAPCTNCRLDEVDCIVSESRRKKYVAALSRVNGVSKPI
jgi:Fungal Zn(2)-Cys(6) binuclear cluster domain